MQRYCPQKIYARVFYWFIAAVSGAVFALILSGESLPFARAQSEGFRNPLNPLGGADPWLVFYEGNYYLATTTWTSELTMRQSPTLAGLKTAEPVQIYYETEPTRCCNMWAPEFRLLEGPNGPRWYFYYTAGIRGSYSAQHTHVLESEGTDPLGPYHYMNRIFDPENDTWAIDGSVLVMDDALYFLFSVWTADEQSLFIAPMSNPWAISGERVLISRPEYDWERSGLNVNEGPVALQHDGDTFIIYSASFCGTPDYKLGMLTFLGDDPLDPSAWLKHPEPVFQRSDENGVFGPGHNGFFRSPDGTQDWIVYHANVSADSGCDGGRTTRVQEFTWNEDGTPNFGEPVSSEDTVSNPAGDHGFDPVPDIQDTLEIVRFESYKTPGTFIRHASFFARIDREIQPIGDAMFMVVGGLADENAVSLMSANFPGWYLRHRNGEIFLQTDDGSEAFKADATWWLRPGLADETGLSFEAHSLPGQYLMPRGVRMRLSTVETDAERERATFLMQPFENE